MQLDNTRIAVRERSLPEVFDLALHVTREFAGPWLLCSLLAIVPLAAINYFLVGWMTDLDYDTDFPGLRYLWSMTLLVLIEAPLASVFVTAFLGPAVFMEQRTVRQVVGDVFRFRRTRADDTRPIVNLILCQLLLRGILPAWLLYLTVDPYQFHVQEGLFIPAIACYSMAMRAFRPYINEIILLEKNPLTSKDPQRITIAKRSSHLHGPSSGDLFVRWIVSAMVGLMLFVLALITAELLLGVLLGILPFEFDPVTEEFTEWHLSWIDLQVVWPACLWLVASYFSVVRFLSYLDLRIRHEGWEVELLMRAEALRMAAKVG
jgi:hypothetical protein